jgi:predicted nucleic acid-binding protein
MELVDTSALILARRHPGAADWLRSSILANDVAICDQVALEFLRGARNGLEFAAFEDTLAAFPWLRIEPVDWDRARDVFRALAAVRADTSRASRSPMRSSPQSPNVIM